MNFSYRSFHFCDDPTTKTWNTRFFTPFCLTSHCYSPVWGTKGMSLYLVFYNVKSLGISLLHGYCTFLLLMFTGGIDKRPSRTFVRQKSQDSILTNLTNRIYGPPFVLCCVVLCEERGRNS